MKKFLLSCFIALGISSSAQHTYRGDFENPGFSATTYKQFGGGSQQAAAACNGAFGGQLALSTTVTRTGYMIDLSTLAGQTNNGQKVDFTVGYKKGAGLVGTIQLAYFKFDAVLNQWSINYVGAPVSLTTAAIATCSTLTGSVPAGTLQPGEVYGIGAWVTRTSGTGNVFVDDINLDQDNSVTTAPACTTITNPANGATVNAGALNMTWAAAPTAVNYKVTVGTTSGASDVFSGTVAGTSLNLGLAKSTTYFAKVVPSNLNGDAVGCTEISFTSNTTIGYCAIAWSGDLVFPISSVTLGGTTKTSPAATGSPFYEDFTSTVFNLNVGLSYTLDVIGAGQGANRFGMTAFVDWNEDGDFDDAGEQYFTTPPYLGGTGTAIPLTGALNVPAGTTPGNKRFRVKYNFGGSTTVLADPLKTACASLTNGQVEDYTIAVTAITAAPSCTTFIAPTSGSTLPSNGTIKWNSTAGATAYKVYVGTAAGVYDIANGTVVTTTSFAVSLTTGTTYYTKIVPTNSIGDATGCTEISFTAGGPLYCTPTPAYTTVEPTTNVNFAGINNTTSPAVGGTPFYEDFSSIVGTVLTGTAYPISLNANTDGPYYHFFAVFIDWNQDGDFNDAGEKYYTSAPFISVNGSNGVAGTPATGTIAVPADAKLGTTRMRVKSAFYGSAGPSTEPNASTFADACVTTGSAFGQIEDYSILVKDATAATVNTDKTKLSVYPNPFTDVLKISDVKGVKSISISDVSGRKVKTMKASNELNVSDLKTGLYIVTLQMEDGSVQSIKAIKK